MVDTDSRRPIAVFAAAILVLGVAVVVARQLDGDPRRPPESIAIDAWVPYWRLDVATPSLGQNAGLLREVSPFFYAARGVTDVGFNENVDVEEANRFIELARLREVPVVASIVDEMPAGGMAAVLAVSETRRQHVDTIAAFAAANDFDGIDIDYEAFAFKDGRDTWETTRPNWVAFITELSTRLRSEGRTLTVSIPPPDYSVYAYDEIEPHVDRIRIMAYDFSTSEPGPIAPLGFVEDTIDEARKLTDDDSKLVLGIALYGRNWLVGTTGTCPADAPGDVVPVFQSDIDDLMVRRQVTATRDESLGESSFSYSLELDGCTQQRQVHYVDAAGTAERIDLARRHFLGGASLWALGFDGAATWQEIDDLAQRPFTVTTTTPSTSVGG
jgi:spore germination protein YaaH